MTRPHETRIAPSLLDCDFAHLAQQIELVERAGAEVLHLDVMDGHFVPNLSIGVPIVAAVRRSTDRFLDTHLMIQDPARYAKAFVDAGADSITFHIEVVDQPAAVARQIRELGVKAGVALNPGTPVDAVLGLLDDVDIFLVMTVWPGFGGQKLIADCLRKVETLASRVGPHQWVEVDGGVNLETAPSAASTGADLLVAGSAIFRSSDPGQAFRDIGRAALGRDVERRKAV